MFSIKNLFFLFLIFSFSNISAQRKGKDFSNILRSTNIYEIDAYLKDAHPDDPKRSILKPRLVKLLKDYIQTAHVGDQRVKDFQEKIALLRKRPSTKIGFEELNEINKQKQIAKFKEELENKTGTTITYLTKEYATNSESTPMISISALRKSTIPAKPCKKPWPASSPKW